MLADTDITQWALNNGLAVAILLGMALGGWRIATWVAPQLRDFVAAQIELVASLQKTTETQTKILEKHGEQLDAIHRKVVGDH